MNSFWVRGMEILDLNLLDSDHYSYIIEGEGEKWTQGPLFSRSYTHLWPHCGWCAWVSGVKLEQERKMMQLFSVLPQNYFCPCEMSEQIAAHSRLCSCSNYDCAALWVLGAWLSLMLNMPLSNKFPDNSGKITHQSSWYYFLKRFYPSSPPLIWWLTS